MRVGVCGGGVFGNVFLSVIASHSSVDDVAVADVDPGRRREMADLAGTESTYSSFDELCAAKDVDAVGIFTPPWLHVEHTLQALRSGKHVLCAVPAALTLEDLDSVVEEVKRSGLVYMNAETSTYYPSFVYCRERFRNGDFGELVIGNANNLHHPRHYSFYNRDFYSNFPPMLYATHTVAMLTGTTGQRLTRVAATGFSGLHPEMYSFRRLDAYRENEHGAESGLFTTEAGGICQVTEGRLVSCQGGTDVLFSLHGTEGSFEEQVGRQIWSSADPAEAVDLNETLLMYGDGPAERPSVLPRRDLPLFGSSGLPPSELPFDAPVTNRFAVGILRSIAYLTDDFVRGCTTGRRFFCDAWQAARFCAPGIAAYESAARGGEWREVPDFGIHPDGPWRPDTDDVPSERGEKDEE
jgi:predicted dehydrogenase